MPPVHKKETPWDEEFRSSRENNQFHLLSENDCRYAFFLLAISVLQKIINHPLCHIALYNDVGLYEKHYIENKFINGYLDIFIYYNNIEDINLFIKLLKN